MSTTNSKPPLVHSRLGPRNPAFSLKGKNPSDNEESSKEYDIGRENENDIKRNGVHGLFFVPIERNKGKIETEDPIPIPNVEHKVCKRISRGYTR